jgi:tetratricopeptide (TPR) repeat protein
MRAVPAHRLAWALALLLALPGVLRAEDKWYELYQGALKSISSRKWSDAEKKLKAAMASGPTPGRQVRMYGVRFIDYLPEYHLGLVYFNQQRYADALEQFAKAQASGQVSKGDPEFASMTDMLELCRIRTAGKQPDSQKGSEDLLRFARELMGRGSLEEARRALDAAAAKNPGGADVAAAREELVRLETEKRLRVAQEKAAEEARLAAAKEARSSPPPAASPSPGTIKVAPSPAASSRPEPATADSVRERAAFEAFYSGEYAAAAERFAGLAERSRRVERDRFLAYAACSRAGAALLRGPAGGSDLERARKLFADAGTTAGRLVAQDGFVSPRIIRALADGTRK